MVEKKFNFYNIFNSYYKNINKTDKTVHSFLYIYDEIKIFTTELDPGYHERMLINYFGIFYILSSSFILNSDLNVLVSIIFLKKRKLISKFRLKKFFFLKLSKQHLNKNVFLCTFTF